MGQREPLYTVYKGQKYLMGSVEISDDGNDVDAIIYDQGIPVEETEPEK